MKTLAYLAVMVAFTGFGLVGCSTTPPSEEKRDAMHDAAKSTLAAMRADSPEFAAFLDRAYAYSVFPDISEGAFVVGGGGGTGEVYEGGRLIGYSKLTKATIGFQAGGQKYAEVIVFENKEALKAFMDKEYKFNAGATAVAIKSGVAANAKFQDGVAVFQHTKGGLMASAALGGQSFSFSPLNP